MKTLSKLIKAELKSRKCSQRALARELGISHSQVSRFIKEETTPTVWTLHRLARHFKMPLKEALKSVPLNGRAARRSERKRRDLGH